MARCRKFDSAQRADTLDGRVDLSVIVPAYNEEKRLPNMIDELMRFLERRRVKAGDRPKKLEQGDTRAEKLYKKSTGHFEYEVIIVNDGSTDNTSGVVFELIRTFGAHIFKFIDLERNLGKGGAVRAGVLAARGDYIMFADADGAATFSEIEKLETFMFEHLESDLIVAVGSRAHMEEEAIATRSLFRTILMKGFHLLVWICLVRSVRDTQCGFKMFNRNAAHLLFKCYHNNSWAFDVELLYLAEQTNCTIGEIAINWREVEGSKVVPFFSWIKMGWHVICLSIMYKTGLYHVPRILEITPDGISFSHTKSTGSSSG